MLGEEFFVFLARRQFLIPTGFITAGSATAMNSLSLSAHYARPARLAAQHWLFAVRTAHTAYCGAQSRAAAALRVHRAVQQEPSQIQLTATSLHVWENDKSGIGRSDVRKCKVSLSLNRPLSRYTALQPISLQLMASWHKVSPGRFHEIRVNIYNTSLNDIGT